MSVIVNETEVTIIDRTLMAIVKKDFNVDELVGFFNDLKAVGVDLFEVDEKTFQAVKEILLLENYIFRVEKRAHLDLCRKYNIRNIIVNEDNLTIIKKLKNEDIKNFEVLLEIDGKKCSELEYIIAMKNIVYKNKINNIRIKGADSWFSCDFIKEFSDMRINLFASNKLHMATASGFQAIVKGISSITTAFCGNDGEEGTSALEEILLSLKVILNAVVNGELERLASMRVSYEKLMHKQLLWNKPIIGKNIFVYESGIHAMGIDKNPETYEPFMPEIVGQKRRMALGKHSSRNSVHLKLNEYNDRFKFSEHEEDIILMEVKRLSVMNKMEISNEQFIDICTRIEAGRDV